jgi:hypothetical protein
MGDLAGKIIEGILKEVVSADFDLNKLLNMGVPIKTYKAADKPINRMTQRQYGASGGLSGGAEDGSNPGSGMTSADQVMSDTAPVTDGGSRKAFVIGKSQKNKIGKAASMDRSESPNEIQPSAADTDTSQPILREEKDEHGFELKLDDQSLLNGFVLSEILGKPKYLRRGRW